MNIYKFKYRLDESKLTKIDINQIDSIALHHMDHETATLFDVTDWHIDGNHWNWCGYGFWIDTNGDIWECRGFKYLNSAVAENNGHIVSIGFRGNYDKTLNMPEAQYNAGVWWIKYLKSILPNVKTVDGHKRWNNTSCPGQHFPLDVMIKQSQIIEDVPNSDSASVDSEFKENLDFLVSYGRINSPEYWIKNCIKGGKCDGEYVKIVLNDFASLLKRMPL